MLRFGIESLDDLPILDATKFAEIESEVEKELTETLGEPVVIEKNIYTDNKADDNNTVESNIDDETHDTEKLDNNDISEAPR